MKFPTRHKVWKPISVIFAGIIFSVAMSVTTFAYGYNTNILTNSTPSSTSGWSVTDGKWNQGDYDGEFKATDGKGPVKASQTVKLSARDKIRANNGELTVSGSGYFWAQASCTMKSKITISASNSSGTSLMSKTTTYDEYKVKKHNEKVSTGTYTIPKGTVSLTYYAQNSDSLALNPPSMRLFYMEINDTVTPSFVSGYSKTSPGKYKKGTVISYALKFSEPVNVSSSGTFTFKVGSQSVSASYSGQSSDGMEVIYDLALPTTTTRGNNLSVSPSSISGLVVYDDAGNSRTVSTSNSLNSTSIYLDNKEPEVTSIGTGASSNSVYKAGEKMNFTLTFDEYIKVSGSPVITLSNGGTAVYTAPSTSTDTMSADFVYTVGEGEDTSHLNITAVKLTGIKDSIGNTATSAPNYSQTAHNAFLTNYNIAIDTTGPVVTFPELSGWTNKFEEPLVVVDEISGVSEVYGLYSELSSVTPSSENVIPETYIIPSPKITGEYYMVAKAVDNIGNVSVSHSEQTYKFDFTNPELSPQYTYVKTDTQNLIKEITVDSTDAHSGVASVIYQWYDQSDTIVLYGDCKDGIAIPHADGTYRLIITAKDVTGNFASAEKDNLDVDATGPKTDFTGIDSVYKKSHTPTINVYDEKCDVTQYSYIISDDASAPNPDDERWIVTDETSFVTPGNFEGIYYLHIKATDECENESICTSPALRVDDLAPTISILPKSNEDNIGKAVYTVAVNVSDGINIYSELSVEYALSESEKFPESGFDLVSDGSVDVKISGKDVYLHIKATDQAGNQAFYTSGIFAADIVSPTGTISKKNDVYYVNTNTVSVMLSANDDYCDNIEMQLNIDGEDLEWENFADEKIVTFETVEGLHKISVRFRDEAGNISEYTEPVLYLCDVTAPVITLNYSETEPTNTDVTVTATVADETSEAEFTSEFQKVFSSNGEFEFTAKDEAGNIARTIATVSNIDKTIPNVNFESPYFDGKNYQTATITIVADDLNGIASIEYCLDDSEDYQTVSGNKVTLSKLDGPRFITVKVTDGVGNVATKASPSVNLDDTAPTATITYTPASRTAQNVEAFITFDEEVTITNNDGSNTYIFPENGEFTFKFVDEAGNTAEKTANVNWIDRTKPVARIVLYDLSGNPVDTTTWVNYDLRAVIVPPANTRLQNVYFDGVIASDAEGIEVVEENNEYIISENGTLSYTIIDTETFVEGEGEAYIRIDKTAPTVLEEDVIRSETKWTNKDVTVRITAKDDLSGVTYTNGNTQTFTENGKHTYVFTDEAGNQSSYTVNVKNIDKTAPAAFVTYFTEGKEFDNISFTNRDVTAVVDFVADNLSPMYVTNNGGIDNVTFSANGSFVFEVADEAGNTGRIIASTTKIDKTAPTGYIVYSASGWTNNDVIATLIATDDNGEIFITNNDSEQYVFTQNGEFTFNFRDSAGNTASVDSFYDRIDKEAPVLSYSLSISETTPFSVYAYVEANERVSYLNNNGSPTIKFNSNGIYNIRAVDKAGNISDLDVVIDNISKASTPVYIEYSETNPTSNDVYATIKPVNPADVIYVTNNDSNKTYKFTQNGDFVFTYKNAAGIEGEAFATVTNIDKVAPEVSVSYSHTEVTNQDVIAIFECTEDVVYPYYAADGKFTFTENATYSIPVTDLVGNITYVTVETNLIDKIAPEISLPSNNVSLKLGETFDSLAGVIISDNVTAEPEITVEGDVDINTIGAYTLTYKAKDSAGNTTAKTMTVSVYDPTKFNIIVNNIVVVGDTVTIDSKDVEIQVINPEGSVVMKLEDGKKKTGTFKKNRNYISLKEKFDKNGIYTIYIQDAERNSKMLWLYVIENQ